MKLEQAILPYAGTSGWSGSEASRERAQRNDGDGTTKGRQEYVLSALDWLGREGVTWQELSNLTGWHHGTTSGALSVLHKEGKVARLKEKRNRCSVYVLPKYAQGLEVSEHGRRKACPHCGGNL